MKISAIIDQTRPDHSIVRNSSLELLRIVAMLMIVGGHFFQFGFQFPHEYITANRLWGQFLALGGQRGNDMFILISGYFLIRSQAMKFRKVFRLLSEFAFYAIVVVSVLVISGAEGFSIKLLRSMLHQWWFVKTYLVLYVLHPYLNLFLNRISRKEYEKFLKTVFICWCVIPTCTALQFEGSNLVYFVCIYSLAGYFRLWADDFGSRKFILYGIFFMMINFLTVCILDIAGLKYAIFADKALYFCGMMRPFTLLSALCFFIGFKKLEIPYSKIINTVAGASLGVYMLHINKFSNQFLWRGYFHSTSFQDSSYFVPYTISVIFTVHILFTLIDLLRSKIFRALSGGRLS